MANAAEVHGEEPHAAHCRAQARRLKELAKQTRFPDITEQLVALACRYEALAQHVEKRISGEERRPR